MSQDEELIRPTQVKREVYIAFGNRCREEGKDICAVLTNLLEMYINRGDSCFK